MTGYFIEVTNIDSIKENILYTKYLNVEVEFTLINSLIDQDNIYLVPILGNINLIL